MILQTLTENTLLKYLPPILVAPYAGQHLNIAIPLLQPPYKVSMNSEDLSIFHSNDPKVQSINYTTKTCYDKELSLEYRITSVASQNFWPGPKPISWSD